MDDFPEYPAGAGRAPSPMGRHPEVWRFLNFFDVNYF